MVSIHIKTEDGIFIPYKRGLEPTLDVFDRTVGDAPGGRESVLTTEDLEAGVKPSSIYELIHGDGKNRILADLNVIVIKALWHRVQGMSAYRSYLLRPDEVQIDVRGEEQIFYVEELSRSFTERKTFARYLASGWDPFAVQILDRLAQADGGRIAGEIFHEMGDLEKQGVLLSQMENIGAAARMLAFARGIPQDPSFYNERCTRWALSDRKLAVIVATEGGTGIDLAQRYVFKRQAEQAQDAILRLFVDYYRSPDPSRLRAALEAMKREIQIADYRLSSPNTEGWIERIEIWHQFSTPLQGMTSQSVTKGDEDSDDQKDSLALQEVPLTYEEKYRSAMEEMERDADSGDGEMIELLLAKARYDAKMARIPFDEARAGSTRIRLGFEKAYRKALARAEASAEEGETLLVISALKLARGYAEAGGIRFNEEWASGILRRIREPEEIEGPSEKFAEELEDLFEE